MNISSEYFNEIGRIDPKDPTGIFKEYYGDWWNFENEWKTHSVEVDHIEAYVWHIKKVSGKFALGPAADLLPDRQYGPGRENKNDAPFNGPAPPANTMVSDCKSQVCKDRLGCVLGEVQKANQNVRSFFVEIEEQRISATRHILHLKALNKYKIDNNLSALSQDDVEKLFEEGIVLEKPDHVDMDDNIPTSSSINRSESFVV